MADPAPSEPPAHPSDPAGSEAERSSTSTEDGGARFDGTRQHVVERQDDDVTTERFANTKLNIALINDPKNGPRFTLTKRDAGMDEVEGDADLPDRVERATPGMGDDRPEAEPGNASTPFETDQSAAQTEQMPAPEASSVDRPAADVASSISPNLTPPPPASSTGLPPAAEPPDKVPVDSSKTFVGQNGTYYDESWRWMDWRGTRRSWNWPAAFSFGHWFAYRRLHRFAGLYLLLLTGLAAATVNDVPVFGLVLIALLAVGITGAYGNILYFRAFRRAVSRVTKTGEGSYDELKGQLAASGGTSVRALCIMGILSGTLILAALGVTYVMRGGFTVNLWPL